MPTAMQRTVQMLRVKALGQERAGWSDRRLLEAFTQSGDESAFAEIVRRHGTLVLGVCRRILGNLQDAEDAFQATFLVLARKSGSLAWHDSIKNWLHGVACRIAMKARGQSLRRKQKEKAASVNGEANQSVAAWNDLRGILDEELGHLPEKYRLVLLLCYLEGKTRDEAAEQLGWTVGSVKGYLERGREMLKARLSKRGLALSLILSAGLLTGASAEAAAPVALASATVQAAMHFHVSSVAPISASVLNLAQGALKAMMIAKIKSAGFVTALLLVAVGAVGSLSYGTGGATASAREGTEFVAFTQEREGDKKKTDELLTLIKELDLKVGTITVGFLRDGGGEDQTYSLAGKDLKVVSTMGQALKMTDLAVGMRAWITLKDRDVTALRVENPTVPAFVSSMDPATRTLEVRAERKLSRLPVSVDAKITVNGKLVRFPEIPLEQRVFITLSFDKKTILAINGNKIVPGNAVRPKEGGDRPKVGDRPKDGERPVERPNVERANVIIGTVIDIDAAKHMLSVLTGRPDDLKIQSITVGKDLKARVLLENQPIREMPIAQLSKPAQVTIKLGDDKTTVTDIAVVAAVTRGIVKSIDVAGKKITMVEGEGRAEKTYAVDTAPYIRVELGERRRATLEDITPRMNVVLALTPDRQRVIGIISAVRRDGER